MMQRGVLVLLVLAHVASGHGLGGPGGSSNCANNCRCHCSASSGSPSLPSAAAPVRIGAEAAPSRIVAPFSGSDRVRGGWHVCLLMFSSLTADIVAVC